jgi:di/tricarboxylate transporter
VAALALSVGGDFLLSLREAHPEFWWHHIWGFFALLGFAACILLVLLAKLLGHYWLQRKEDYYE